MGTVDGAVGGSALVFAQNCPRGLLKLGASVVDGVPIVSQVVSPGRRLLRLGILVVWSVCHFPSGVVGRLRATGVVRVFKQDQETK